LRKQPPPTPFPAGPVRPLRGRGDVLDRSVEPDVEYLIIETGTRPSVFCDRHAPVEIARDSPRLQPFVEPFIGDRAGQRWPFLRRIHPGADALGHPVLQQEEMRRVPDLEAL